MPDNQTHPYEVTAGDNAGCIDLTCYSAHFTTLEEAMVAYNAVLNDYTWASITHNGWLLAYSHPGYSNIKSDMSDFR